MASSVEQQSLPASEPVRPILLTARNPTDKMKELTDRLEEGIQEVFQSRKYQEYLQVMSKFYNYSFNNLILIAMQKPDASLVAGYSAWQKQFGRHVKKGEKGIKILAPMFQKRKVDEEEKTVAEPTEGQTEETEKIEKVITGFKVVSVFDVSQTEGKELPSYGVDMLRGGVDDYPIFFQAIRKIAPVPVGVEDIPGEAHGYYHQTEKRIAIAEGMSEIQNVKTLLHEIAHAKLHDIDRDVPEEQQKNQPDRYTKEVQAESIAYVICQHYGMDTSEYSFAYIAGWSTDREVPELKASLDTIRSTAREMITEIDQQMSIIRNYRKEEQVQKTEKGNCLEQNGMDIQNKDRRTMEGKEVVGRGLSIR